MAVRALGRATGTAFGVAALVGAGQLGIGYGLGILRLEGTLSIGAWRAGLAWVAYLAALAVVCGAGFGAGQARRAGARRSVLLRVLVSFTAAVGAMVTVPLVYRPAAAANLPEPGNPALVAMLAAGAGVILGLVVAVAVLSSRALAANVILSAVWIWAAALASAGWNLAKGGAWGTAGLGQLPLLSIYRTAVLIGAPVLIGLVTAAVARRRGARPAAVAASGLAGPLLSTGAYLVAGPAGPQTPAYRDALLAAGGALAVTLLVALVRRRPRPQPALATKPVTGVQPAVVPAPRTRSTRGSTGAAVPVSAATPAAVPVFAATPAAVPVFATTPAAVPVPVPTALPAVVQAKGKAARSAGTKATGRAAARDVGMVEPMSAVVTAKSLSPAPAPASVTATPAGGPVKTTVKSAEPVKATAKPASTGKSAGSAKVAATPTVPAGPTKSVSPAPPTKPASSAPPTKSASPAPSTKAASPAPTPPSPPRPVVGPAPAPPPATRKGRKARRQEARAAARAGHVVAQPGSLRPTANGSSTKEPVAVGASALRGKAARDAELVDWVRALATQESNLTGD